MLAKWGWGWGVSISLGILGKGSPYHRGPHIALTSGPVFIVSLWGGERVGKYRVTQCQKIKLYLYSVMLFTVLFLSPFMGLIHSFTNFLLLTVWDRGRWVGQGKVGGVTHRVLCAWKLLGLAVKGPWLAPGGSILAWAA